MIDFNAEQPKEPKVTVRGFYDGFYVQCTSNEEITTHSFTQEERAAIEQKIMEYHQDSHSRSGGAYLEKELAYVERFLNSLITHMDNIHKALEPKETKKATLAQALADKEQALVEQLQVTYADLSSSALRDMGKRAFADGHLDYTNEELALRLAIFHVTHK